MGWTLSFSATDMRLVQYVEANGDGTKAEARETIQIVLVPYRHNGFPPHFSMFGTDRIIKDITLSVRRASQDNPSHRCSLWGIVSYTTLEKETYPDALGFEVSLADQHFEALRHAALGVGGEYSIVFDVLRAAGFYSDWSPDIYTSRVKVLTAYPEQRVELPSDSKDVPRLGAVGEFKLAISRRAVPSAWNTPLLEEVSEEAETVSPPLEDVPVHVNERDASASPTLVEINRIQHAIGKLRLPLWLLLLCAVAALLFQK